MISVSYGAVRHEANERAAATCRRSVRATLLATDILVRRLSMLRVASIQSLFFHVAKWVNISDTDWAAPQQ